MAFVSTNSNIRVSILGFIKHLVSKTIYRAIEILLKPCCDITILDVEATCSLVTPGNYDITITLDKSVNMLGNGIFFVSINKVLASSVGGSMLFQYNDSTKITLTNVNIGSNSGGTFTVDVFLLLPTGNAAGNIQSAQDLTPGAFTIASSDIDFNFPSCTS